jgi:hypothetical protein
MIVFCWYDYIYSSIAVTAGVHNPMAFTCPYFWNKVLLLDFGEKCPRFVFYIDSGYFVKTG